MSKTRRLMSTIVVLVGITALFAPSAFAHTDTSSMALRGQCGGQIHSWQQYMNNLSVFGAVAQAANVNRSAGYSPRDGSFRQWLKERVVVTRLAVPATIRNYGCNANGLFGAGNKYLPKGWPVLVALPAKYSKSGIRLSPARGYKAIVVSVRLVGQASCTNPGKAIVKIVIYVKVHVKPKPPKKPTVKPPAPPVKPPAGSCNITITGSNITINGDVNNCSTVTTTVVCGNISRTFTGPNSKEEATSWQQANCSTPPTCCSPPPPPPPCCSPPPPPTPTPCVTITSVIDLNDVPENRTSGQLPFKVNACGAGSVTVDPGNGGISRCDSNVKQASVTFDLAAGNNSLCVIYYAPGEASVTTGSITYTAIQGSAKDVKVDTFAITHPIRP